MAQDIDDNEELDYKPEDHVDDGILDDIENDPASDAMEGASSFAKDKIEEKVKDKAKEKGKEALEKIAQERAKGKVSKAVASKAGAAGGATFGIVIVIILIVIIILGLILAFVYMPSMLTDGIKKEVRKFTQSVATFFNGAEGKVDEQAILDLATYARDKGFNLYGDGFVAERLETTNKADSVVIPEEGIAINEETGEVTDLVFENSILRKYALINAYTYTLENDKNAISKAITSVGTFFSSTARNITNSGPAGADNFDGMIVLEIAKDDDYTQRVSGLEQGARDLFQNLNYDLDLENMTLSLRRGWFNNPYIFDIEGWIGRYGMPTEFLLALHKSTMAPDLIGEMINGTKIDEEANKYLKTKLYLRLMEAEGDVEGGFKIPSTTSIHGVLYDSNGTPVENPDLEALNNGEVVYYAKTKDHVFPLKTNEGSRNFSKPNNSDGYLDYSIPNAETEYDIIDVYVDYSDANNPRVRDLTNYVINAKLINAIINSGIFGSTGTKEANLFILNYGLHDFLIDFENNADADEKIGNKIQSKGVREAFAETLDDAVKAITKQNYKAFLPLIYKVENHWFRDVYFFMKPGEKYTQIDKDYFIKKGEAWTKFKEDNTIEVNPDENRDVDYAEVNSGDENTDDDGWKAYKIQKLEDHEINAGFRPYIMNTYDPNNVEGEVQENAERFNVPDSIKYFQTMGDYIQIKEGLNLRVSQVADARRGETNERTKNLFKNTEWYIYDGVNENADKINDAKASDDDTGKKYINKNQDLLAGGIMLETMDSLDSQLAYRDYKELLLELAYFEKEDLDDRIRQVMQWPVAKAAGALWPGGAYNKDINEFGTKILSKESVDKIIEQHSVEGTEPNPEEQIEKLKQSVNYMYGPGIEEGDKIIAPVTGKIISQDDNSIEIMALHAEDNVPEYQRFFDDEYKGSIAGYTIKIKNINVGITDESKYKRQIPKSQIDRIDNKEIREEAEAAEKEKEDAPTRVGEYIKEGTIVGTATGEDIVLLMYDIDKALVEHIDKYIVIKRSGFYPQIQEDYFVKITEGGPNQLDPDTDVELFKQMFSDYPVISEYAEAFLEMQKKYDVNAIFAAAVSIKESSGGTNFDHIPEEFNNIFSIKGITGNAGEWNFDTRVGNYGTGPWKVYRSVRESVMDFGRLIAEGSSYFRANNFYVSEIAVPYCETSEEWATGVNNLMTQAIERSYDDDRTQPPAPPTTPSSNNANNSNPTNTTSSISQISNNVSRQPFDILRKLNSGYYSSENYNNSANLMDNNPPSDNDKVEAFISEAKKHVGKDYILGTQGPNTFDCSGLVHYCLNLIEPTNPIVSSGRTNAYTQYERAANKIPTSDIQRGDIIFFDYRGDVRAHVGIYLGGDQLLHASSPGVGVIIGPLDRANMTYAARPFI